MSRIGKRPIGVPKSVTATLDGNTIKVKGPKGELQRRLHPEMQIVYENGEITVRRPSEESKHKALHGLTRSLVANMVEGVSQGFRRQLDLVGVGFRAAKQGGDLVLSLGYSHPIRYTPPEGVTIEVPVPTQVIVSDTNKEVVGQVAAKIRSFRKPEPYKGKGVMYRGEVIRRKAGKSGKAGKGK